MSLVGGQLGSAVLIIQGFATPYALSVVLITWREQFAFLALR